MTLEEIKALIATINDSNLSEFKMKSEDFEIQIRTDKYEKAKGAQPIISQAPPVVQVPQVSQPSAVAAQENGTSSDLKPQESASSGGQAGDEATNEGNFITVRSPIVGTFYRASSPDKSPYVKVGDTVEKGNVLCVIEAMKLFNEIESEVSGKVVKVLTEDAQPVEYDQPLFLIDPNG